MRHAIGRDGRHSFTVVAALVAFAVALLVLAAPAWAVPKQWTLMLYLDGEDINMQSDYLAAFDAMIAANVGSDANVNVVVQFDRMPGNPGYGGWTEAERFYVTPGMQPIPANAIADWGDGQGGREVNMADGATLRTFVTWAAVSYPADRYALIVADHGFGWRGLCIDWTSAGESMPLKSFATALQGLPFSIDLLGLDACLMQTADVGYELRACDIDVVVGSEVPGTTWPLAQDIAAITSAPGVATETLARQYCDLYFAAHPGEHDLTQSAYRLDEMAPLASAVKALGDALATPPHDTVPQRSQDVIATLQQAVFYTLASDDLPGTYGMSVYFPDFEGPEHQTIPAEFISFYLPEVAAFSEDGGWRSLLWGYYNRAPDLDHRLFNARQSVVMIEDTADLYDLCRRLVSLPPSTTADGWDSDWHRLPVDVTLTATPGAGGLPVGFTEYRLDDGAWTHGTVATVAAPADHSGDGMHTVDYRSADTSVPPLLEKYDTCTVKIDTTGPVTLAPRRASVHRGAVVTLRYRVNDALSEKAKVTIRVKTLGGRTVRMLRGTRTTNTALQSRFLCQLPRGTYRFWVYARDLAGNAQTSVGRNRLVVRGRVP